MRSVTVLALAATVAAVASGCGGSGADGDWTPVPKGQRAAISEVVQALEDPDPQLLCSELLSARLVDQVFSIPERCVALVRKARADRDSEPQPQRVVVSGHVRRANQVRVTVKAGVAGSTDPFTGHVYLLRSGDRWRVDDFDDAYRRGNIATALGAHGGAGQALGEYDTPELRAVVARCGKTMAADLDTDEVDRVYEQLMRFDPRTQQRLGRESVACIAEDDTGASQLTDVFLGNVGKQFDDAGLSDEAFACIEKGFRSAHTDEEIATTLVRDLEADNHMATLGSWIKAAARQC